MPRMNSPEICANCPYLNDGYYDPLLHEYIDVWECERPEGPCVEDDPEEEEDDDE